MSLRYVAYLIIAITMYISIASAVTPGLDIQQGATVYYGDVVDVRGITGWTENISWWKSFNEPSIDPPDHIVTIDKFENYKITAILEPGEWYQWYGENERKPVMVFYVINAQRPPPKANVTPTPVQANTSIAPVAPRRIQPAPIADFVVARHQNFTWDSGDNAQVWVIGPSVILGNRTNSPFTMNPVEIMPGEYTIFFQYPDGNDVFELFPTGEYIDSIWKGVDPLWVKPLSPSVLMAKIRILFNDTDHFHGRIVEKKMIVGEQSVDIATIDQTEEGVFVSGITNLPVGEPIRIVMDVEKNVIRQDRNRSTFTAYAEGDDIGAVRVWRGTMNINFQKEPVGVHFLTAYPPYGEPVTVPFYISEKFEPFDVPLKTFRFINNSPFIPTPTPEIVMKEVPVTVVKTITIEVTPAYAVVKQAQDEAAAASRKALESKITFWSVAGIALLVIGYLGYRGTRYGISVVKRARMR
jgi:hypothetical protein